jgi:histidine phosphotransferase ChpT
MPDKPDLAALVGSRICHDLISPIGAIGNGVELFVMETSMKGPELSLITESIGHANARIKFFRIAFGATSTDQRMAGTEVKSILAGMTEGGRYSIDWQGPVDLARRDVKLVFLLILCLETALPYGGQITIGWVDARWSLRTAGPRVKIEAQLWECLIAPDPAVEVGPAQVQFLLVPEEVIRQHRRLSTELTANEITLSF